MKFDAKAINRYLNDDVSLEEWNEVVDWLETDEGHPLLSQFMDKDINVIANEENKQLVDHEVPTERMKARFLSAIQRPQKKFVWLKVAAVAVPFILLVGSVFFLSDRLGIFTQPEYASIEVPCGENLQVILQDGTLVHLNSASKIRYPKNFGLFSRKIELSGEAYFKVVKDKQRPFIVDLKGVCIRVLGTQFNVKAYEDDPIIQVMLDEGNVRLEDRIDKKYSLKSGEFADYDRRTGICQITRVKDKDAVSGWRSHNLNFYRVPLSKILMTLERQYDVNFQVHDKRLLNVHFTLSTSKMQIADILKDLESVSFIHFSGDESHKTFEVSSKIK